ncbi:mediator of RNA polymerase II transcription subunit 13-like [Tubulanus polymorphus]|uniref:mediator of RNA polymerase II transcription subunit 13-like n=1 Tax=Tubulanus polymorphus TaxID=672921 RepID=UPI003DA5271E
MSHPNPLINGCSLEDCYTNLFALTDLTGIKWRKLCAENDNVLLVDPLDDPVLLTFSRCIQNDILCIWKRVPRASVHHRGPAELSHGKELWIFWYGKDEPTNIDELISKDLTQLDRGTWDNGLSYECRTLLFKALHNLIERCLLSHSFVRLGKWFVQPYDWTSGLFEKSPHFSIAFSFFLHGESTVCSSIDVRQHPPVHRLTQELLNSAQDPSTEIQVILAPYGLAGTLTGQSYRDSDPYTRKLMDDWRQFYPIMNVRDKEYPNSDEKLPNMVEVKVGGVRMRYPSCFVLVTDMDDTTPHMATPNHPVTGNIRRQVSIVSNSSLTPPTSPCDQTNVCGGEAGAKLSGLCGGNVVDPAGRTPNGRLMGNHVIERVTQDVSVAPQGRRQPVQNMENPDDPANWDCTDPTHKSHCGCSKLKLNKPRPVGLSSQNKDKASMIPGGKYTKLEKGDKSEKLQSKHSRVNSFHRRSHVSEDIIQNDVDLVMQRIANPSLTNFKGPATGSSGSSSGGGGASGNNIPPPIRTTNYEQQGVESPHSAAPSPLVASHSQPAVNAAAATDATMPTLSPHPPTTSAANNAAAVNKLDKDPNRHHHQSIAQNESQQQNGIINNNIINHHQNNQSSSSANSNPAADIVYGKPPGSVPKTEPYTPTYHMNGSVDSCASKSEKTTSFSDGLLPTWMDATKHTDKKGFKRPVLPGTSVEGDEVSECKSLYDFSSLNTWLQHPVKKLKSDSCGKLDNSRTMNQMNSGFNCLAGTRAPMRSPSHMSNAPNNHDIYDPYEFREDFDPGASLQWSSLRHRDDFFPRPSPFGIKEEDNKDFKNRKDEKSGSVGAGGDMTAASPHTPTAPTSLMSEKDLVPAYGDLDHIFDTSGDESNDDTFQEPSAIKITEDCNTKINKGSSLNSSTGSEMIGPTELSRMFPTPPSLENNTAPSPADNAHDHLMIMDHHMYTPKPEPILTPEEPEKDWSYAFKITPVSMFVGSPKYNPIELPSSHSPSVHIPATCFYKPSWQYPLPMIEKQPMSQYNSLPSMDNISCRGPPERMMAMETSPAMFQGGSQQRTPLSYELQSPASNASSYMNKNLSSIDNHGTNSQIPEAHGLIVNIVLSDSIVNIFRDHNFDSCNICVCNLSIKGADSGLYLADPMGMYEPQDRCSCGFSAVVNRRYGYCSGLFYEDEVDVTGIRDDRYDRRKPSLLSLAADNNNQQGKDPTAASEDVPHDILHLLQDQVANVFTSCSVLRMLEQLRISAMNNSNTSGLVNVLEVKDTRRVCLSAFEQGKQAMDNCSPTKLDDPHKLSSIHKWPHVPAKVPANTQDMVRMLKSLQPLLQDAIQKKRTTRLWEATYTITGPLTWKDFHKLAGRGADEACEPQPIPPLLVKYEKDWLSLSPYAIRYWEKLFLEPYCHTKDIAYVVVAPENDYVINHVRTFFKQLGVIYEQCRLGRHCPVDKVLRDGILRVGKKAAKKLAGYEVDDWFMNLGSSPTAHRLRLYAQACRYHLAPHLAEQNLDKTLFESSSKRTPPPPPPPPMTQPSPHPPSSLDGQQQNQQQLNQSTSVSTPQSQDEKDAETVNQPERATQSETESDDKDGASCPTLVIYMVDPYCYGQDYETTSRLSMLGLTRVFHQMKQNLPEQMQCNIQLQIIPLQTILDKTTADTQLQLLKSLAFSVFTQSKRLLVHQMVGRSLTGFGPISGGDEFLKSKELSKGATPRLHSPLYILGMPLDRPSLIDSGDNVSSSSLFCCYCLSEDQRWLLATITDERGELFQNCTINIEIPNRNRRKKASARKIGLQKLWDFILGVISMTTIPWRLVVHRIGRLGHGELKGWAGLLSKKNLLRVSKRIKEICGSCSHLSNNETPCILSACLVSMEPQGTFQVMPDLLKEEEKQASYRPLTTPRDASATHILVFPTSATAQANTQVYQQQDQIDFSSAMDDVGLDDEDINLAIEDHDFNSFFGLQDFPSPEGSPQGGPTSPSGGLGLGVGGHHSPSQFSGIGKSGLGLPLDPQEESPNLLQQPLAMGYYVSTAKVGPMPKWFWSSCPHQEHVCPVCFKFALHIHSPSVQQIQDDLFHTTQTKVNHPLDSSFTCDVLRYVLEMYNALSWLTMDMSTNDRRSCLPIHFVVLMQMYHALNAFV